MPSGRKAARDAASADGSYRPGYCKAAIACLGAGHSIGALAGEIGVSRETVLAWAADIAEFGEALRIGEAKAVLAWEKILIDIATNGGGNATLAMFALKNRAGEDWRDRQDPRQTGISITIAGEAAGL